MKIKFYVELDITNIEFDMCFSMVIGVDVAFRNEKFHVKLNI